MSVCLETSSRYKYSYWEFLVTKFIVSLCFCCKQSECYKRRQTRFKRHQTAQQRMAKETDFFQFLKLLRITRFMAKFFFKKYQRDLVPYFHKYQLEKLDGDYLHRDEDEQDANDGEMSARRPVQKLFRN